MSLYKKHIDTVLKLGPQNSQVFIADRCGITKDQVSYIARRYRDKTGVKISFKGSRTLGEPTNHDKYAEKVKQLAAIYSISDIAKELGISRASVTTVITSEERINGVIIKCKKGSHPVAKPNNQKVFNVGGGLLNTSWL